MLTIRGADQVCTSLRAARKSLSDGGLTSKSRIEELDLMIGELVVGGPSFRGDGARSKTQIDAFVSALTQEPPDAGVADGPPSRLDDALGHFRRAAATLQRLSTPPDPAVV